MGNLFSILYLALFCLAGWALSRRLAPQLTVQGQLVTGSSLALVLLEALPALFALFLGFRLIAALAALFIVFALLHVLRHSIFSAPAFSKAGSAFWLCVLPLLLFSCWLLYTHTLYFKDGAYWCGQSTFGDLPMHLAFIESIARSGSFPPNYPLLAGQAVFGYPFLCESISSLFLLLGADLKLACLLPSFLAMFSVLGGGWFLGSEMLSSARKASLGYWLFFLGSGFGFVCFLGGGVENFTRIFTGYYQTPTNYVEGNIRWVNPIADMLVPQRATLFGWALLFPCLAVLVRFFKRQETSLWPLLFLLAAPLPLVHTHSALALVMISAVLFCGSFFLKSSRTVISSWLLWALTSAAVWLPQLFGIIFKQTSSGNNFLRFHFNWANDGDNYFWFYIKNIGLVYLLLIPAFLWADKSLKWIYGGGLLILFVSEFIVFQPNYYDNNKLLFIWHLLGCMLAANLVVDCLQKISKRSVAAGLLVCFVFFATIGSILTLGREAVSRYMQFGPDAIAAGEFIYSNTDPDDLILTGQQHLNPAASLAGANIVCGSSLYVYFHGTEYGEQLEAVRKMYESPSRSLLEHWGVDYIMISSWERKDFSLKEEWFQNNCSQVFHQGEYVIYKV